MEVLTNRRGNKAVVVDSYMFRKDRAHAETITWRCSIKGCTSRCRTDLAIENLLLLPTPHIPFHEAKSQSFLDMERARSSVKNKAAENPNDKPGKVACSEAVKYESLSYKAVTNLTKSYKRVRMSKQPPLPRSLGEVFVALSEFDFSQLDVDIFVNDPETKIVLLASREGLSHLASSENVLGDGTFKFCTKFFFQLYTVHGVGENGMYIPCAFFLLPDKKEDTYKKMLDFLQEAVSHVQGSFLPLVWHLDMETAMLNAVASRHSSAEIKLCRFHLAQAWYRQIQQCGLVRAYLEKDSSTGQWLRLLFGLPSLPADEVSDFFRDVMLATEPEDTAIIQLTEYLKKFYMNEDSKLPPALWSGIDDVISTTNACEAFHRQLEHSCSAVHPSLWNFVLGINTEVTKAKLKIRCNSPMPSKRSRRLAVEKKDTLKALYVFGQICQYTYVLEMSRAMQPVQL